MLMQEATPEMIEAWKKTWNEYKEKLRPNRKSGAQLVKYLKSKYPLAGLHDDETTQLVICNVLENKPYTDKLFAESKPSAVTFIVQ